MSLSVNGKLHTVLRTLTQAAVRNVHYLEDPFLSTNLDADDTCVDPYYCDERFLLHRNNRIRSMVRQLVVRYPLVLGTSMLRITERIDAMDAARASYSEFVTILRRSTRAHNKWLTSQIGEEAVVKLQNKVMKKVVKKKVKVERDVVDVIPKMDDLSDIFEPIEINEEELIVGGWKRHSSTNKKDISDGHNSCLKVSTSFKLTDTVIESTNINEAISDSDGNKVENDGRIDSDSIADTSGRLLHNYPQLYQQQEPTDQHRQIFQPMVPNVNIAINSIYKNPIGNTLSYPYLFPDTVKDIVDKNINIYATVTKDSNQSRDSNINSNTEESFGNRLKAFEDSLSLNMIEPKIETVWTYTNSSDKKTVLNLSTILDIQSFILKRRIKRLEERETTDSNDIEHFQ